MSFKDNLDAINAITESEDAAEEEQVTLDDDDAELAVAYGQGARVASSSPNVVGAHANLAAILSRLVNISLCSLGNHKFMRDPKMGIRQVKRNGKKYWKGAVSQTCAYCGTIVNFTSGEAVTPDELIPTEVIESSVASLRELARTMDELYEEMVNSDLYTKYVDEYWDLYNSNARGIDMTRGAILAIMKSIPRVTQSEREKVLECFNKFRDEWRAQKKSKPKPGPARKKFKELASEREE